MITTDLNQCHLRLRSAIEKYVSLPEEEWNVFALQVKEMHVPRNAFLFCPGEQVDNIHFVCEGILRAFYLTEDGLEVTRNFTQEDNFLTAELSFYTFVPSELGAQALEDSHLLYFSRDTIEQLYERHKCWERLGRRIAEANYIRKELKEMGAKLLSPEERYLRILETDPTIIKRVPLYHLASYLKITPETLSRIRRKHVENHL